jgi:hypothetical protein
MLAQQLISIEELMNTTEERKNLPKPIVPKAPFFILTLAEWDYELNRYESNKGEQYLNILQMHLYFLVR